VNASTRRTLLVWAALVVAFLAIFWLTRAEELPSRPWADVEAAIEADELEGIRWVDGVEYELSTRGGELFASEGVLTSEQMEVLAERGIYLDYDMGLLGIFGSLLGLVPLLVVVAAVVLGLLWYARRKQVQQGGGAALEMRKSRARLVETPPATRFADVGGCEEAKARLLDVVDYLKHPEAWAAAGARAPRGILLEGPPGSGKTLLARAVAGEAGVRFFVVSGSEFVEMFVGIGAARVRDLFEQAGKVAPAVIFIDELDAIGRRRGSGVGQWNEEREQTLNQILVSMDGFEPQQRVVVIGATNRSDILDPALIRPGRFDVRLRIPPLDPSSAGQVLRIHARGKPLHPEVDLDAWAANAIGATGAGLEQLLNEAALLAVRRREARGGAVELRDEDLADALAALRTQGEAFEPLDRALVDSAWQLSRGDGSQRARIQLADGEVVEGVLVWADGNFLKLRREDGSEVALARRQVLRVEVPAPAAPPGT